MARKLKVSVVVLNVRIHPHSAEKYVELLRMVYGQRKPAKVHGDRYGLISSLSLRREGDGFVEGVFTTFTDIELDGDWFDIQALDEAGPDKLKELNIPDGVFPNIATYFFTFNTKTHRMYVETYSRGRTLTPLSAVKFLQNLLGEPAIVENFGHPSISLVQNTASLEVLFSIERIKEISITIEKPNADVFADNFEEEIEKHLLETHSQSVEISHRAVSGQSIQPNEEIRQISSAALDNGEVKVKGRENGVAVSLSSRDFPKILQSKYDPEVTSEKQAFDKLVRDAE